MKLEMKLEHIPSQKVYQYWWVYLPSLTSLCGNTVTNSEVTFIFMKDACKKQSRSSVKT